MSRAERRAKVRNDDAAKIARLLLSSRPTSMNRYNLLGKARAAMRAHDEGRGLLATDVLATLVASVNAATVQEREIDQSVADFEQRFPGDTAMASGLLEDLSRVRR